jgi:hypothetical protein
MTISRLISDKKTMYCAAISVVPPKIAKLENCMESRSEGIKIGKARIERIPILLFVFDAIALTIVSVDEILVLPKTTAIKNNP